MSQGKKLPIDFPPEPPHRDRPDTDHADLIASLCTQAGMLMEDASLLVVTMRREADDGVGVALRQSVIDAGVAARK